MFRLNHAHRSASQAGENIETVFPSLERAGFNFRTGQMILLAGPPGGCKSLLAMTQVLKSGRDAVYFSMDSDAFTQQTRAMSIICQIPLKDAEEHYYKTVTGGGSLPRPISDKLSESKVWFDFSTSLGQQALEQKINEFTEVYEKYPSIIVVDNIGDIVVSKTGTENQEKMQGSSIYLANLARETGACVIATHHVTARFNGSVSEKRDDQPVVSIPLAGVRGQITEKAYGVLTTNKIQPNLLRVAIVKYRGGQADASGNVYVELGFDGARMNIYDL